MAKQLTKLDAVRLFERATDQENLWEHLMDDFYDEETDSFPSIYDVMVALGVSKEEYMQATSAQNVDWPEETGTPSALINTSVEVKGPVEYGMTLAAYMIAGADVWPWHKGYKPLDTEECSHHLYGWEECGFMKHAGIAESASGDFKSPLELIEAVKQGKGA
ncbi:TPA: hypothetical protein RQK36_003932 [Vibrio vulnificus]|nr:hypothetical protein [Vibrio vulnificus]